MAIRSLLLNLLLSMPKSPGLCPDGEIANFHCNQETRVCDDDPTLFCHPIKGVYFCCAGPHFTKIPDPINFVPEFQQRPGLPNFDDGDDDVVQTTTISSITTKAPDEECKDANPKVCEEVKKQCASKALRNTMKAQCAATCKFCCADKRKECAYWVKYGFCQSDQITQQKKEELCPKSCNMCGELRQ